MSYSLALPPIHESTLHCRPNITLYSLIAYYQAHRKEPRIHSKDVPRLFYGMKVDRLEEDLDEWVQRQPIEKRARIVRNKKENECAICLEKCEHPTMSMCCSHIYCGKCILTNAMMSSKCPICRAPLPVTQWMWMESTVSTDPYTGHLSKMDTFLQLVRSTLMTHPTAQFMVYSRHDNTYYQLYDEMMQMGIRAERLESQLFPMLKTIERYKKGETQILFLSKTDLLRGLSLTNTTHLIFYQDLSEESYHVQRQILLHAAQRLKRATPLQILHLDAEIEV